MLVGVQLKGVSNMRAVFPCYIANFSCGYTVQEATRRILESDVGQNSDRKIMETDDLDSQKIRLKTHQHSGFLWHNSYMPIVHIELRKIAQGTRVSMVFELPKFVKIGTLIYSMIAGIFEIAMLASWFCRQLPTPWLLCIPLGMAIVAHILGNAGLYFSSKDVFDTLLLDFSCDSVHSSDGCVDENGGSKALENPQTIRLKRNA